MLRVTFQDGPSDSTTVKLEGRVVGKFAEAARTAIAPRKFAGNLVVDLSEVIYVDSLGEAVLVWLRKTGAGFLAGNCYSGYVCESLQLPIAQRTASVSARDRSECPCY
jgi:hypothetical protein